MLRSYIGLTLDLPRPWSAGLETRLSFSEYECIGYMLNRPLSAEPILRLIFDAGQIAPEKRSSICNRLRLFRAFARAIDDLIDESPTEPAGRSATWRIFGSSLTTQCGLWLCRESIQSIPERSVRFAAVKATIAMVNAVALEQSLRNRSTIWTISTERLARLERQVRWKEIGYWYLILSLVWPHWQSSPRRWNETTRTVLEMGNLWQEVDDLRDLADDVEARSISSAITKLLEILPSAGAAALRSRLLKQSRAKLESEVIPERWQVSLHDEKERLTLRGERMLEQLGRLARHEKVEYA